MVVAFAGLALPGLFLFGVEGFVAGRIATSVAMLVVRRHYVRRLFPAVALLPLALRGVVPVALGGAATVAVRVALSPGTIPELALFLAVTGGATWLLERGLLRELLAETFRRRSQGAGPARPDPAAV